MHARLEREMSNGSRQLTHLVQGKFLVVPLLLRPSGHSKLFRARAGAGHVLADLAHQVELVVRQPEVRTGNQQ